MGDHSEFGANWEARVGGPWGGLSGEGGAERGSVYARKIWKESPSMYLPPMLYHEFFAAYQDNFLPYARANAGGERYEPAVDGRVARAVEPIHTVLGPGVRGLGRACAGRRAGRVQQLEADGAGERAEIAAVQQFPDWVGSFRPRLAARVLGQYATPEQGQFFALGGGTVFRGFDLAERQGSMMWVGNVEVRWPLAQQVTWDALDHTVGARNVWLAAFYDVGAVYANGHMIGGNVAQAVGAGLRVDIAIFSFIERATLRFDVGKTINAATPLQFWFGVQQTF